MATQCLARRGGATRQPRSRRHPRPAAALRCGGFPASISLRTDTASMLRRSARQISGLISSITRHMIYDNISATIGRTPVVPSNRLGPRNVQLYVKLGGRQSGRPRSRIARARIIEDASGAASSARAGQVVEATSATPGIALAMVCAARGYPFVAADARVVLRRAPARSCARTVQGGADPAAERASGAVRMADKLGAEPAGLSRASSTTRQNPAYHRQTTGPRSCRTSRACGSITG